MISSIRKINAHIRKTNRAFKRASRAEQRVQIAKDVLEQLRLGRLVPLKGIYFDNDAIEQKLTPRAKNKELRDVFQKMETCNVCALGACFVATVDRVDAIKVGDLSMYDGRGTFTLDDNDMRRYLTQFFNPAQLRAIEYAFESFDNDHFNFGVNTSAERMERVMNAIVKQKGRCVFRREKHPYVPVAVEEQPTG